MQPTGSSQKPAEPPPSNIGATVALAWLRKLRWAGTVGILVLTVGVHWGLQVELPLLPLCVCLGVMVLTNWAARPARSWSDQAAHGVCVALVSLDVLILTGILALTGGAAIPFALLYLVHIAMAATCLRPWEIVTTAALCCAGYGALHHWQAELPMIHPSLVCGPAFNYSGHLRGMLIAFVLTTVGIAFFVHRLNHALWAREEELSHARARADRAERFAAVATLAAGVAHEIGSPLGTIVVAAGELRRAAAALENPGTLVEDAELIAEEAARCRSVLDRMARDADEALEPATAVMVGAILGELSGQLSPVERTRVHITCDIEDQSLRVPVRDLAQGLALLVRNACAASTSHSRVELRVRSQESRIVFEVADTGVGMTSEVLAHAGEPFFTTREPGQGTGLGLFVVRLLADRLDGRLELVSEPGRGTTARLVLPCIASQG